ncbi:MAG: ANTAR domain-containing protein [Nocardioides sp.]|nr:ANTAR domain-containing protein [Nocardioides sp.]
MHPDKLESTLDALAVRGVECLTLAAAATVVAEEAGNGWGAHHVRVVRGRGPSGETLASLGAPPAPGPSPLVRRVEMGPVRAVPCELVLSIRDPSTVGSTHLEHDLRLFARQAGWFLASVDRLENLHHAMATRATIAQAQGLLMARYDIDAYQAFLVMRRQSQETHVRLAQIAADLVATAPSVDLGEAL